MIAILWNLLCYYCEHYYFTYYFGANTVGFLFANLNNEEFWKHVIKQGYINMIDYAVQLVPLNKPSYIHEALKLKNKKLGIQFVRKLVEKHNCLVDKLAIMYAIKNQDKIALEYLSTIISIEANQNTGITALDLIKLYLEEENTKNNINLSDTQYILYHIRNEHFWLRAIQLGQYQLIQKAAEFGIVLKDPVYIREAIRNDKDNDEVILALTEVHKSKIPDHFIIREKADQSGVVMDIVRETDKPNKSQEEPLVISTSPNFLKELLQQRRNVIETE